ncbi:DNA helicase RecQ [Novosphingopyxis baekryungensis]|uniref:DNA helicase RecQ n=1 Tax=Novosphingopyxis baekryungensis TaxID=279369 RepID=UPI0003B4BBF8|nr:DNA helicase RecQ [Novosphingopyxis baekryungensis]
MPSDPLDILHSIFGFSGFRGRQAEVVDRIMLGENTLAVMPTGAGKSLCYQVPAVARNGTCVVVSPLIALMHDQMRAADAVGIKAATLTSVDENQAETMQRFRAGDLDLLYVAPERATNPVFQDMLSATDLSLFAIDEAHCVSEWGHDFRPDYRLLRPMLDRFEHVPRLALTATADKATREDILLQLGIPQDGLILAGFDRPNIRYGISAKTSMTRQLSDFVRDTPGAGIVYCTSRAATEKLAEKLGETGRPTRAYHAGLPPRERARAQAEFVASEDMVMCATIAFGMGIDKPDVRFVAHAGLPKSLEAYYQETGRAGRDGDPALAQMFWGASDFATARQRLAEVEEARREGERARLNALAALVETPGCRRAVLLRHFGESPPPSCGNCDNCIDPPDTREVTELARKLLSAVYRTGQSFGVTHIEAVLKGSESEKVLEKDHHKLSVYGIVEGEDARLIRPLARHLSAFEALVPTEHGGLKLGPTARAILRGEEEVRMVEPPEKKRGGARDGASANPMGDPLFEALRAERKRIATEQGIPPYVVFHDSVLREFAAERPQTPTELGRISGVGAKKLIAFGDQFLDVIRQY